MKSVKFANAPSADSLLLPLDMAKAVKAYYESLHGVDSVEVVPTESPLEYTVSVTFGRPKIVPVLIDLSLPGDLGDSE